MPTSSAGRQNFGERKSCTALCEQTVRHDACTYDWFERDSPLGTPDKSNARISIRRSRCRCWKVFREHSNDEPADSICRRIEP